MKGTSKTTITLPKLTIEQQLNCLEFSVQILAKILGKIPCKILSRIFVGEILPRILARSCQDFAKILHKLRLKQSWQEFMRSHQDFGKILLGLNFLKRRTVNHQYGAALLMCIQWSSHMILSVNTTNMYTILLSGRDSCRTRQLIYGEFKK